MVMLQNIINTIKRIKVMDIKKPLLMKSAEVIDAWRVVPRTLLVAYGALTLHVVNWFMTIPEPTTSQTFLVTTISGLASVVIGLYNNSSKNWIEYNREFTDRILKLENPKEFISLTSARMLDTDKNNNFYSGRMSSSFDYQPRDSFYDNDRYPQRRTSQPSYKQNDESEIMNPQER
jgi:hypothetical protein